jgi:hypothetical protein
VQAWVKTLGDLHGLEFKPYSTHQFTTCFNIYLEILKTVDDHVNGALEPSAPDWRLKNCCPACTYKLEGEAELIFNMLVTGDGNPSLKRVLMKERGEFDDNGAPRRGWCELPNPRAADARGLCRHGFVLMLVDMVKSGEL